MINQDQTSVQPRVVLLHTCMPSMLSAQILCSRNHLCMGSAVNRRRGATSMHAKSQPSFILHIVSNARQKTCVHCTRSIVRHSAHLHKHIVARLEGDITAECRPHLAV